MFGRSKSFDYFEKFMEMSSLCGEGSILLKEVLEDYDSSQLNTSIEGMKILRDGLAKNKEAMVNRLVVDFLPPIDREDILLLIRSLDKLIENQEDIVLGLYMFRVKDLIPEAIEFSHFIEDGVGILMELVIEFENFQKSRNLKEKVMDIHKIKNQANRLYVNSMRNLYDYSRLFDPRGVISWTRILDLLMSTINRIEYVADTIESIVLKTK